VSLSASSPSRRTAHRRGSGVSLLILAGLAWGTGGLLGSLLGRETGLIPLAVAAYRLGLGGLLVLTAVGGLALIKACLVDQRRSGARRRCPGGITSHGSRPFLAGPEHRRPALYRIGLLAVLAATFQACYFAAVSVTTVGLATLATIGTAPVVVVAVERLRGRARRGSLPIVVLALLGLGLLVGLPATGTDPLAALTGAAAAVVAGFAFAVMTLVGARTVPGLDPMVATGASFVVGGLLLAVPAAMLGRMAFPVTFSGVGLLALFAVLPTALAYTAYFRGLGAATSPGTGAVLALLEPLTAAVLAAVVLGERLEPAGMFGAALLTVAVLLAARADRR
jgi:DME family drug/metabolite transporter